jgi:GTP-binding protein Era
MMQAVKGSLEDADLALLLVDVQDDPEASDSIFASLRLKVPAIVVLNKTDRVTPGQLEAVRSFFASKSYCRAVVAVSALHRAGLDQLMQQIIQWLPEGEPFYDADDISDLPQKFFVGELIREKIYDLYEQEIPYHSTVLVQEFREKQTLVKIRAEIIVQRETQKAIIIGDKGSMIKKLGTEARKDIEEFLGRKVFLELFVKVRPKWRENETFLREYGY